MENNKDVSIIEWRQLPAPADRYLLVRYLDPEFDDGYISEVAYSIDGTHFLGDTEEPFHAEIEAWAFLPYDN